MWIEQATRREPYDAFTKQKKQMKDAYHNMMRATAPIFRKPGGNFSVSLLKEIKGKVAET